MYFLCDVHVLLPFLELVLFTGVGGADSVCIVSSTSEKRITFMSKYRKDYI